MTFRNIISFFLVSMYVHTYNSFKMSEYASCDHQTLTAVYSCIHSTNIHSCMYVHSVFKYQQVNILPSKNQVLCKINHC